MLEVIVKELDPNQIMEIVRELRQQGLVQGDHFDFAYQQAKWDPISGHNVHGRHTVFTFYKEKYATLFILKYVTS